MSASRGRTEEIIRREKSRCVEWKPVANDLASHRQTRCRQRDDGGSRKNGKRETRMCGIGRGNSVFHYLGRGHGQSFRLADTAAEPGERPVPRRFGLN